ncbi:MAG: hypothetical protein A3H32_14410 [Betaproteobacteria bacterium RIFCSPLOWO2_02_FULL_63_19]|nr:MAG: hypothetical protein A3H32_14410 [Betaproteobacteria bacterium RIFCSPLOWO2_02_FULL_63_19]
MKINPNTKRHGKAAALALWRELGKTEGSNYGEPGRLQRTRETLAAYLAGYARATAEARRGFLMYAGDFMEITHGVGLPNLPMWQKPKHVHGPKLIDAECKAHARAWLNAGKT